MRPLLAALALFAAAPLRAGIYTLQPALPWPPSATPSISPTPSESPTSTATPAKTRREKGSPTATATPVDSATVTPTPVPRVKLLLLPFADKRRNKQLHTGRTALDHVYVEAEGRTLLAKAWLKPPYGDLMVFLHHELARGLVQRGFEVSAAAEPSSLPPSVQAAAAGAAYALGGEVKRLNIVKRGADSLFGTNLSGTNYHFNFDLTVRAWDQAGQAVFEGPAAGQVTYYHPRALGASDRETFPVYFTQGLPQAAAEVAGLDGLRDLAFLPRYTPTTTPTPTIPPALVTPPPTQAVKIVVATPTPEPKPAGAYWVCPKDGKEMDVKWENCPWDGTPRSKFILKHR